MNLPRIFLIAVFFMYTPVFAQSPPLNASADIYLKIKKLKVLGAVLYLAAHPDDENTRLLGWLANEKLLRTGYLSMTRGDGGQNLIGDEQGVELGLIRTQELLAARRVDGAEQFFTRAYDFGFSKSTEEALRIWDKQKILSDVVWIIRKFQPDIMITRFPPDARAGHGHHSASAVLANEAFKLAADPAAFPSQFKYGVKPWQARRIFWNTYNFGTVNTIEKGQLQAEVGGFNALLGKSYGEIAAQSRSQHKSQGFGVPAGRGVFYESFSFTDGNKAAGELEEGIDLSWKRIGAPAIETRINAILQKYSVADPSLSVPALVSLYKEINRLPSGYWTKQKLSELQDIIGAASGLWIEAFTTQPSVMQGATATVNFALNHRNGAAGIIVKSIRLGQFDTTLNQKSENNKNISVSKMMEVAADQPVSQPYWLREKMNEGVFNVNDQTLIGRADAEPAYTAVFEISIEGALFKFERAVMYKHTDPVKGELYQPFAVVPSPKNAASAGILRHIQYDHIPSIYYFNRDTASIVINDVKTAGKKVGYIVGAGDKVPEALLRMGYEVSLITEKEITPVFLAQFDAVITGVRAYNVHEYLTDKNQVLNEYIKNGGNLIVQYNTNSNAGPIRAAIGPYPFVISRNRVTDERSPFKFLLPTHPVFNYPNRITNNDFDNWIQERGIYFAEQLDPAFETPLALNDPGESDMNGSIIIADYGKGKFVYTGLAFFRELPAGVNGAYRLLANIIALNQKINE